MDIVNIVKVMGETLNKKIENNVEEIAKLKQLTQRIQDEEEKNHEHFFTTLTETKRCQEENLTKIVENAAMILVLEKYINDLKNKTEEKIEELTVEIENEKVEIFEVIKLLGLTHTLTLTLIIVFKSVKKSGIC